MLKILDDTFHKIDIEQDLKGIKLFPADRIPEDFHEQQPPSVKIIHVIVQAPTTATASKIMEGIMKLSDTREVYSNPKNFLLLPFPYPGRYTHQPKVSESKVQFFIKMYQI
ncbi:hypothetical protein Glove_48g38 [Diversispora epigaea]|uniref:Uncharacterized protein n=1 Tax=Diversispora epigaea TaxID=1348612 RepID=A0A397JGF7_9GLOM|nr:hypothetical protein Glove_48g38 [Diversispora epigaea]